MNLTIREAIGQDDFYEIKANSNFTVIGHMVEEKEGAHLITRANTKIALKARGGMLWKNKNKKAILPNVSLFLNRQFH